MTLARRTEAAPPEIALSEIPLSRLWLWRQRVERRAGQDHSRWIFLDRSAEGGPAVYKIWNPDYVRRDGVPLALREGLATPDTVPGLTGVIWSRGTCRGYRMALGAPTGRADPIFVRALWEATRRSGLCFRQYKRHHLRRWGPSTGMIDIEAVLPVTEAARGAAGPLEDADYHAYVRALAARPMSADEARAWADRHAGGGGGPPAQPWLARKRDGLRRRIERAWTRAFDDRRGLVEP